MDHKVNQKTIHEDITIDDVKKCQGFENISDEMALKIVDAIKAYTKIIYTSFINKRFPEQKIVDSNKDQES